MRPSPSPVSFVVRLDNVTNLNFGDAENVIALYVDALSGSGWWYEGGGLFVWAGDNEREAVRMCGLVVRGRRFVRVGWRKMFVLGGGNNASVWYEGQRRNMQAFDVMTELCPGTFSIEPPLPAAH